MYQSRTTSQSSRSKVVALLIAAAYLTSTPISASAQQGGNIDLSRLMSNLNTMIRINSGGGWSVDRSGGFINTTIVHNGRNWNLIATGARAADSTAPVTITFNGDTVKLDSTGTTMIAPVGGPQVTVGLKKNSLSFQYGGNNSSGQWSTDIDPALNLIAITLAPESELVKEAGQLQEHLGRLQDKLRSSPVAAPADSAHVAAGFKIHMKLKEVKEILKQISADLDASR